MSEKTRTLTTSALWYAFGQLDAGAAPELNTGHADEFRLLYEQVADECESGTSYYRPSVMDAWRRFVRLKQAFGRDASVTVDDLRHDRAAGLRG